MTISGEDTCSCTYNKKIAWSDHAPKKSEHTAMLQRSKQAKTTLLNDIATISHGFVVEIRHGKACTLIYCVVYLKHTGRLRYSNEAVTARCVYALAKK